MLDDTDGKWPLHDGWPLQYGKVYHNSFFGYGTEPEGWSTVDVSSILTNARITISVQRRKNVLASPAKS